MPRMLLLEEPFAPTLPRLVVDDGPVDRSTTREFQTMVDSLRIKQIILLTRSRVDEPAMPAFELKVESEDIERFCANFIGISTSLYLREQYIETTNL